MRGADDVLILLPVESTVGATLAIDSETKRLDAVRDS